MRQKTGAVLALALLGFAVSACGSGTSDPSPSPTGTTSAPVSPSPTPVASPTTAPLPLSGRVLTAADVPAALAGTRRTLAPTATVGVCNRVSLLTLGATRTSGVAYVGQGHTVANVVAKLADEKTVALVTRTLRSLHDKCSMPTTPITTVAGTTGAGWRYVATTGNGKSEGLGVAVAGRLMTVVAVSGDTATVTARLDGLLTSASRRIG